MYYAASKGAAFSPMPSLGWLLERNSYFVYLSTLYFYEIFSKIFLVAAIVVVCTRMARLTFSAEKQATFARNDFIDALQFALATFRLASHSCVR